MTRRHRRLAYRLLLGLLPRARRDRHGAAMTEVFDQLAEAARADRGRLGLASLWLREAIGLVRFAWRDRAAALRSRRPGRHSRSAPKRLRSFAADLTLAARTLGSQPALALTLLVTIGLGVGVTTSVFAVVHGVLLEPLPFPAPGRLVDLWEVRTDGLQAHGTISGFEAVEWSRRLSAVDAIAAYRYAPLTLTGRGDAARLIGIEVTPAFFDVLGRRPLAGRTFTRDETGPAALVVVLGEPLWRSRFGGDPTIVGRRIELDGQSREIVGVMPADAAYPRKAEAWIPVRDDLARLPRGQHFLSAVARVRPNLTIADARADLARVARDLEGEFPDVNRGHGADLEPLTDSVVGTIRPVLRVLLATSLVVLLIVTANMSSLLLARAIARRREFAVRRALGAAGLDLVMHLSAEGVMLALPGGVLGLLLASWITRAMLVPVQATFPRAADVHIGAAVVTFALFITVAVGVAAALLPLVRVLRASRSGLAGRAVTVDRQALRLRHLIVVGQVAAAFALVGGSLLLSQSVLALSHVETGFQPTGALTFNMQLAPSAYADPIRQTDFAARAVSSLTALPGVTAAGLVSDLPFSGSRSTSGYEVEDRPETRDHSRAADLRVATPGYLSAMGIPLLTGRPFDAHDDARSEPVAIVNRAFADATWPGEDPIGKRLRVGHPDEIAIFGHPVWRTVVGVVGNVVHDDLRARPAQEFYLPFAQSPLRRLAFVVRTAGDPGSLAGPARRALAGVDAAEAIYGVRPMTDRLAEAMSTPRLLAMLTGLFAATAVVLAAFGLYASLSFAVAERAGEFGIRLALGAGPSRIAATVGRDTAWILAAGLAVGAGVSALSARWLASSLFGVRPTDGETLAIAAALVLAMGALATIRPVRRALGCDPARLLRDAGH